MANLARKLKSKLVEKMQERMGAFRPLIRAVSYYKSFTIVLLVSLTCFLSMRDNSFPTVLHVFVNLCEYIVGNVLL